MCIGLAWISHSFPTPVFGVAVTQRKGRRRLARRGLESRSCAPPVNFCVSTPPEHDLGDRQRHHQMGEYSPEVIEAEWLDVPPVRRLVRATEDT